MRDNLVSVCPHVVATTRAFHSALPPETAALRPSIHLRGGWILEGLIDRVEDDDCGAIVGMLGVIDDDDG